MNDKYYKKYLKYKNKYLKLMNKQFGGSEAKTNRNNLVKDICKLDICSEDDLEVFTTKNAQKFFADSFSSDLWGKKGDNYSLGLLLRILYFLILDYYSEDIDGKLEEPILQSLRKKVTSSSENDSTKGIISYFGVKWTQAKYLNLKNPSQNIQDFIEDWELNDKVDRELLFINLLILRRMYLDTVNAGDKKKFLQKSFMDAIIEQIQDQTPPKDPTEKEKIKKLIEENKSLWEQTKIKDLFEKYFQLNGELNGDELNKNISKIVEMFIEEITYRQNNPKTKEEAEAPLKKEEAEAPLKKKIQWMPFISAIGP